MTVRLAHQLRQPAAALAGLALVGGLLVGCGGGDDDDKATGSSGAGSDAPADASKESFCDGFGDF